VTQYRCQIPGCNFYSEGVAAYLFHAIEDHGETDFRVVVKLAADAEQS
jgi:hypothetical protein